MRPLLVTLAAAWLIGSLLNLLPGVTMGFLGFAIVWVAVFILAVIVLPARFWAERLGDALYWWNPFRKPKTFKYYDNSQVPRQYVEVPFGHVTDYTRGFSEVCYR